jgi:hypothetical protein
MSTSFVLWQISDASGIEQVQSMMSYMLVRTGSSACLGNYSLNFIFFFIVTIIFSGPFLWCVRLVGRDVPQMQQQGPHWLAGRQGHPISWCPASRCHCGPDTRWACSTASEDIDGFALHLAVSLTPLTP